jgi:hypothetical protein
MDNMIRTAPMGYTMAAHYGENKYQSVKMLTCDWCDGSGLNYYCGECDLNIEQCKCGEGQVMKSEKCENCKGEGEIEL